MLTTEKILKKASEEFNLPFETVKANYEAWVKGFKDVLLEKPIVYFFLPGNIPMYYNRNIDLAAHGSRIISSKLRKSKRDKERVVDKIKEKLHVSNSKQKTRNLNIYDNIPPLEYYGFWKGITLKELEETQQRMFDKYNKHEY